MHIWLSAIGRARRDENQALYQHYTGRLRWDLTLKQIDPAKISAKNTTKRIELEGKALLDSVPERAKLVVLDERGKSLSSMKFATRLQTWQDEGISDIAFAIGGADGHADCVRKKADLLISFGEMTWPHMMVRIMLAEQLYRAQQIIAGHPYHREG